MTESHDLAAAYALDALDGDELDAYVEHLAGCGQCRHEVAQLREAAGSLAVAEAVEPPVELRSKVLGSLSEESSRAPSRGSLRWAWGTAAAASVIVVVLAGLLASTTGRLSVAEQVAEVYVAADAQVVVVDSSQVGPAQFTYSSAQRRGVFVGFSMPQPSSDQTYQLWLIGPDGPVPAGTFSPEADGSASVLVEGEVHSGLVLGLTEEPAGGSEQPTGDVLLAADL